ncbi:MAG: hypothetical protein ACI4JJ_07495 [Huintestinicola sp.]
MDNEKNISALHFEEESRLVKTSADRITPEDAANTGRAAVYAAARSAEHHGGRVRVCVGWSGSEGAKALAYAFASGVCSAGGEAAAVGECTSPALAYSVRRLAADMGCHISADVTAAMMFFAGDGLTLFPDTEAAIEEHLCGTHHAENVYSHYGSITECGGMTEVYMSRLSGILGGYLHGIFADVNSPSRDIMSCTERLLAGKNDREGSRIAFHITGDGRKLSAYSDSTGYVFHDRLLMICCRDLFSRGYDAADCPDLPKAAERMAESFGRKVIGCGKNICTSESARSVRCEQARSLASEQSFMRDGCALMLTVLEILRRRGVSLKQLLSELPDYSVASRYIPMKSPSELLRRLCTAEGAGSGDSGRDCGDGVLMNNGNGRVTITPVRTGKGMMLRVESFGAAMEAASELCDFYEDIIGKALHSFGKV